jgi:DNA-directed RNA polymerase specialized sigma subunit
MDLKKPEICDALESTRLSVFKNSRALNRDNNTNKETRLKNERINQFIEQFRLMKNREPTKTEIIEELSDEITSDFLDKYVAETTTSKMLGGYEENIVIDIDV